MYKFIFQSILGWNIEGNIPPEIKKCIITAAPHTSWHDFFLGAYIRSAIGVEINYVAKKELFKWPFGAYFRWMGGAPIDRSKKGKTVEQTVRLFEEKKIFRLAIAPEGTRQKVDTWKTGFYHIAHQAKVPIVRMALDYKNRTVKIAPPFYTTGDIEKDMLGIRSFYKGIKGKKDK